MRTVYPCFTNYFITFRNIHASAADTKTSMISLCISLPSHCGSTLHTEGVFPVFCFKSMPNILVFVNIHQSRTTASKIEIIQKNITKRILSCQKFIPEFTPCFPADMIVMRYRAQMTAVSIANEILPFRLNFLLIPYSSSNFWAFGVIVQ